MDERSKLAPAEVPAIEALYATGYWLYVRGCYADAAAVFRAMVLCAPAEERGWLALGACHEAVGQPEVALQMYGAARVLAPPSPQCEAARARILGAEGEEP